MMEEGERMESLVLSAQADFYNEKDFVYERNEKENCVHEYVAPKDYMRPEFKRPS